MWGSTWRSPLCGRAHRARLLHLERQRRGGVHGGDDCLYEFEINALGTVYEAFFVWQDALKPGSRFDRPEYDLRTRSVDLLGGFRTPRVTAGTGAASAGRSWTGIFRGWRAACASTA